MGSLTTPQAPTWSCMVLYSSTGCLRWCDRTVRWRQRARFGSPRGPIAGTSHSHHIHPHQTSSWPCSQSSAYAVVSMIDRHAFDTPEPVVMPKLYASCGDGMPRFRETRMFAEGSLHPFDWLFEFTSRRPLDVFFFFVCFLVSLLCALDVGFESFNHRFILFFAPGRALSALSTSALSQARFSFT